MPPESLVFAHLADAHVGAWPRNPEFRRRLRDGVLGAIRVAAERGAEFLLISGDLFHTPVPEPAEVAPIAAALRRFGAGGRRIYAIYGSHDYVAHRTSWLDVLSEAGAFVRVAPENVRPEGERWTLPWVVDGPTGVRIAGVSGRSHGLDREYYGSMDSRPFAAEPGFRIFQFHAAVEEYLPDHLRRHIRGIRREDLPAGVDYYAGGHIHFTYVGEGPGGGPLVNPGAVFGTSRTDVENGEAGRTHRGVVIVTVRDGKAVPEFVDTTVPGGILPIDIDVTGVPPGSIPDLVARRVEEAAAAPGTIVMSRLTGESSAGVPSGHDFAAQREALRANGVELQVDSSALLVGDGREGALVPESAVEAEETGRLLEPGAAPPAWLLEGDGAGTVRELLTELGTPKEEGQSNLDYAQLRRTGARRILGVPPVGSD